jgi:hypothetical protein
VGGLDHHAGDRVEDAAALAGGGEPGTFTFFSWAWYISAMPRGTRWLTTARATVAPLALIASTQSLSWMPTLLASSSAIQK